MRQFRRGLAEQKIIAAVLLCIIASLLLAILAVVMVRRQATTPTQRKIGDSRIAQSQPHDSVESPVDSVPPGVADQMVDKHTKTMWSLINRLADGTHIMDDSLATLTVGSDDMIDVVKGKRLITRPRNEGYRTFWYINEEGTKTSTLTSIISDRSGFDQGLHELIATEWSLTEAVFSKQDHATSVRLIKAARDFHEHADNIVGHDDSQLNSIRSKYNVVVKHCGWTDTYETSAFSVEMNAVGEHYVFKCELRDIRNSLPNEHVRFDLSFWPRKQMPIHQKPS